MNRRSVKANNSDVEIAWKGTGESLAGVFPGCPVDYQPIDIRESFSWEQWGRVPERTVTITLHARAFDYDLPPKGYRMRLGAEHWGRTRSRSDRRRNDGV